MSSAAAAARRADQMGADTIWVWDHFYPLYGDPAGNHFEAYTLLAALAAQTQHAELGLMVTCNSYRHPHLLADMIRTIAHISGGSAPLGAGRAGVGEKRAPDPAGGGFRAEVGSAQAGNLLQFAVHPVPQRSSRMRGSRLA